MPAIETDLLFQKALYWEKTGVNEFGQDEVEDTPVELDVRWLTKRRKVLASNGELISLDATVIVDQDIVIGSRMWLGTLEEWYGTGSGVEPPSSTEVMVVKTFDSTPDIGDKETRRECGLMKYKGSPTQT